MTINQLFNGTQQSVADVLLNKDQRFMLQNQLVQDHPDKTVVTVKMNVPGPVKNTKGLSNVFSSGVEILEYYFNEYGLAYQLVEQWDKMTGMERFYLLLGDARNIKKICTIFEDQVKLGRLFDVDVLIQFDNQVIPISRRNLGLQERRCFICGGPAKECARSRKHNVRELQQSIVSIVNYEEKYE